MERPSVEEIDTALAVMTDPTRQPVLVHCNHGADRTGIAVAAYRIRCDHWQVADAVTELRQLGRAPPGLLVG